jgi:hypothetical protein
MKEIKSQKPNKREFAIMLANLCEDSTDSSYLPEKDEIQYHIDYFKVVDELLKVCNIQMKPKKDEGN